MRPTTDLPPKTAPSVGLARAERDAVLRALSVTRPGPTPAVPPSQIPAASLAPGTGRRLSMGTKLLLGNLLVIAVCFAVPAVVEQLYPDRSGSALLAVRIASIFIGVLTAGIVSLILARSMARNIEVLSASADRISSGDLSAPVRLESGVSFADETERLAVSVNRMVANLRDLVWHIQSTSASLADSAERLTESVGGIRSTADGVARSVDQIARGAELQSELVDKSRGAIDRMATLTQQVGQAADDTSQAVRATSEAARVGAENARHAVDKLRNVFERVERASGMVIDFGQRTREVRQFVDVITHVAQQTHLLALNATIEAARAGEAGRGFAVVADEVRKLAENTNRSAEQISRLVESIGGETEKVVGSMREGIDDLASGREELAALGHALENILASAVGSAEKVETIARIAREQLRGADDAVKAIANISQVTEGNAASTVEVSAATEQQSASVAEAASAVEQLAEYSRHMQNVVSSFKL
jgi:methyl-accepting chemotaxis protein